VTVTGAPKLWAMQFVEDHERLIGALVCRRHRAMNFDGSINTGLTTPHHSDEGRPGRSAGRRDLSVRFGSAAEDRECPGNGRRTFSALRGDPPKPLSGVRAGCHRLGQRVLADRS